MKKKMEKMEHAGGLADEMIMLRAQLQEGEQQRREAAEKIAMLREKVEESISSLASEAGFFCGVVLDHDNLLKVIDIAFKTRDKVKIPFQLYAIAMNEKESEHKKQQV